MRISQRLTVSLMVSIVMMAVMVVVSQYDRSKIIYIKDQAAIVDNMAILVYKLNKDESNFFLNLTTDTAQEYEQHYQALVTL